MEDLTVNDYLNFFRHLDMKEKVNVLAKLTSILNNDIMNIEDKSESVAVETNDHVIDELFGVWVDEDNLTESTIIHRTNSDKKIDLD